MLRVLSQSADSLVIEISSIRDQFQGDIQVDELEETIAKISKHLEMLRSKEKQLSESILKAPLAGRLSPINLESCLSSCSLENQSDSLASSILDFTCFVSLSNETPLSDLKLKMSKVESALNSLEQYLELYKGVSRAVFEKYHKEPRVALNLQVHRINDLIFNHGQNFQGFQFIGKGAWGKAELCYLDMQKFVIKTPLPPEPLVCADPSFENQLSYDNVHSRDFYATLPLNHPNIIQVCGVYQGNPILEYANSGDLRRIFCYSPSIIFSEVNLLKLFIGVIEGVNYLHGKGVIHKDLKPANILLSKNKRGVFRPIIADFGAAVPECVSLKKPTLSGTEDYMSPEVLCILARNNSKVSQQILNAEVTCRSDIYSCGLILFELITGGRHLYPEMRIGKTSKKCALKESQSTGPASITYSRKTLSKEGELIDKKRFTIPYLQAACSRAHSRWKEHGIRDPRLKEPLLLIVHDCLELLPENRPTSNELLQRLMDLAKTVCSEEEIKKIFAESVCGNRRKPQ